MAGNTEANETEPASHGNTHSCKRRQAEALLMKCSVEGEGWPGHALALSLSLQSISVTAQMASSNKHKEAHGEKPIVWCVLKVSAKQSFQCQEI